MKKLMLTLLAALAVGTAGAREWSEEIQMTNAGQHNLGTSNMLCSVMDTQNRIHTLLRYNGFDNEEGYHRRQAVYQLFDAKGRPLSEPFLPAVNVGYRGEVDGLKRSIAIGNDGRIYLLWSATPRLYQRVRFLTILDSLGEVIEPSIEIESMPMEYYDGNTPNLFIDSRGNLVLVSYVTADSAHRLGFHRFDPDGMPFGETHFLGGDGIFVTRYYAALGAGDTLHVAYQYNEVNAEKIRYFKVGPDNEVVVDDFWIETVHGERGVWMTALAVDQMGRPVFLVFDNDDEFYLLRYSSAMELEIEAGVGESGIGAEGLIIDEENNIHVLANFRDERYRANKALAYLCLAENGDILDSLQIVHHAGMDQGGDRPADWIECDILLSNQGSVIALWDDRRFESGGELYMRYSPLVNRIVEESYPSIPSTLMIEAIYPNPFNASTTIKYSLAEAGLVSLKVFDLSGREVATLVNEAQQAGHYAASFRGDGLPSGVYLARLDAGNEAVSMKITLVK